jgi:uncharacterized damage-inducible protein DinB
MTMTTSATPVSSRTSISEKDRFLKTFEKEAATTLNVLRAYPEAECELKPHERSKTALSLAWMFVMEQMLLVNALKGESIFGGGLAKPPEGWATIIETYEKGRDELLSQLRDPTNPNLDGAVPFFTGPKQMGDIPLDEFVWFILHDQIHHRGQLSVYLRMAGGKVPSIYGPTADEPWN